MDYTEILFTDSDSCLIKGWIWIGFGDTLLPSHRYHVQFYIRENLKNLKQSKSLESTVF